MSDGQVLVLAGPLVSLLDFGNYTLKDWAQLLVAVFGLVGSVVGAWKWWRYSKWQIVNRLFEYLNADEKNVTEGRRIVLAYLRSGRRAALRSDVEFHATITKAIKLLDANRTIEAEAVLNAFALMLKGSAEVGRRHTAVASEQAATILLFVALIARQRADVTAARDALTEALDQCPDDAEVMRSLGELDLDVDPTAAQSRFDEAIRLAPGDSLFQGELHVLKAKAFGLQHVPPLKEQRKALVEAAGQLAAAGADRQAAEAYDQAGELEIRLGWKRRARESANNALRLYQRLNDERGEENMRVRLKALGATPPAPLSKTAIAGKWISWRTVRIAVEVAILASAALLFYLSLR
jgi:tetratricopeptide (TPR) repeat protein